MLDGDPEDTMSLAWMKKECPVLLEGKYGSPQFDIIGSCPQVSTSNTYYSGSKYKPTMWNGILRNESCRSQMFLNHFSKPIHCFHA